MAASWFVILRKKTRSHCPSAPIQKHFTAAISGESCTRPFATLQLTFRTLFRSQILASKNDSSSHIIDVIEDTIKKSQSSVVGFVKCDNSDASFPTSYAVRLIYPICRQTTVPTLQSLCLSQIKSKVNQSNINSLPLPTKIKEYVRENYHTLWAGSSSAAQHISLHPRFEGLLIPNPITCCILSYFHYLSESVLLQFSNQSR